MKIDEALEIYKNQFLLKPSIEILRKIKALLPSEEWQEIKNEFKEKVIATTFLDIDLLEFLAEEEDYETFIKTHGRKRRKPLLPCYKS